MRRPNITIIAMLAIGILAGCATTDSDMPEIPTLSLSPSLLIDSRDVGDNVPVALKVEVAEGAILGNPYQFDPAPDALFASLFEDALDKQGFDTTTDDIDEETPHSQLVVTVEKLKVRIKKATLKSEVEAEVSLALSVRTPEKSGTFRVSSLRTLEVALQATPDEVAPVVSRAVAQVVERAIKDKKLVETLHFDVNKFKKEDNNTDGGLFGF